MRNRLWSNSMLAMILMAVSATGLQTVASAAKTPDDPTLAARVRAALQDSNATAPYDLQVNAAHGVITVNGTVDSPSIGPEAQRVILAVPGVKSVSEALTVDPNMSTPAMQENQP